MNSVIKEKQGQSAWEEEPAVILIPCAPAFEPGILNEHTVMVLAKYQILLLPGDKRVTSYPILACAISCQNVSSSIAQAGFILPALTKEENCTRTSARANPARFQ